MRSNCRLTLVEAAVTAQCVWSCSVFGSAQSGGGLSLPEAEPVTQRIAQMREQDGAVVYGR